jgi:hypothetical protein
MRLSAFFRKQAVPLASDWRLTTDPEDVREYDGFGPWIYPIRSSDDLPRRFRHCYEELQAAAFFVKVPINAERSAMRPGMDLYRSVLAIYPERVVVLEWNGEELTRRDIAMDAIQAVRTSSDLLPSDLTLLVADGGQVRLEYNAVSSQEMDKIVDFLRQRMIASRTSSGHAVASGPARPGTEIRDFFYHGVWEMRLRRVPAARILHWEAPGINCRNQGGWGRSSLGCLVVDEGGDLCVINRGQSMRFWLETVYSKVFWYIPWPTIKAAELIHKPSRRQQSIAALRLTLAGHVVDLELFAPASELERLLAAILRVVAVAPP